MFLAYHVFGSGHFLHCPIYLLEILRQLKCIKGYKDYTYREDILCLRSSSSVIKAAETFFGERSLGAC